MTTEKNSFVLKATIAFDSLETPGSDATYTFYSEHYPATPDELAFPLIKSVSEIRYGVGQKGFPITTTGTITLFDYINSFGENLEVSYLLERTNRAKFYCFCWI